MTMKKTTPSSCALIRGVAALTAATLIALSSAVASTPGEAPRHVVRTTADDVIAILKDEGLSAGEKRDRITVVVEDRFDFITLCRLVMARNWKKLSKEQQQEFVDEFKTHLTITYGRNVENYRNEKVVITGDREEARGDWTVKTIIERPAAENVKVDYRLRKLDGRWKMIDMIVEGVSMVANFRSQFQDIISKSGPAKVIELLREKNAKAEPLKS
jgi:phospholipid transport system substrate-binding protein